MTCGLLLLDKPRGISSSGATQRVRRLLRVDKAGHVGSLDPLATGMLPICLGEATKIAGEVLEGAKTYSFRLALGSRTATGDVEGAIVETAPVPPLDSGGIRRVLDGFLGETLQVPPMYSALKREGRPLYEMARAGVTVERPPRTIHIESLDLVAIGEGWIDCVVRCGKGTYVRTLAEDIARGLGTCGHVATLRRESVDPFPAGSMITLQDLEARIRAGHGVLPLVSADDALGHLPAIHLDEEQARRARLGQALRVARSLAAGQPPAGPVDPDETGSAAATGHGPEAADAAGLGPEWTIRLYGPGATFMGLGWARSDGRVRPKRLFAPGPGLA